jgi:hypothetical protein
MNRSSVAFQLGDVITGEPHLHCSQWLSDRGQLARMQQDPRALRLKAAAAIHLPRMILMACSAAAIVLWFVASSTAEGPQSAGRITSECAERDLKVVRLLEEHGNASTLPASVLGEAGLAQLDARLTCLSGLQVEALAMYDSILTSLGLARQATK